MDFACNAPMAAKRVNSTVSTEVTSNVKFAILALLSPTATATEHAVQVWDYLQRQPEPVKHVVIPSA